MRAKQTLEEFYFLYMDPVLILLNFILVWKSFQLDLSQWFGTDNGKYFPILIRILKGCASKVTAFQIVPNYTDELFT